MVIIFIISCSGNLFMVIFLYMCIIFISLYNVYVNKLTFNQLLYQIVINNHLSRLATNLVEQNRTYVVHISNPIDRVFKV